MNNENDKQDKRINTINNKNYKKMLCYNKLKSGECKYGKNCMYAHNLKEQRVESIRDKVYKIIKYKTDLSEFDLLNGSGKELYSTFISLTRVCTYCLGRKCTGGYNCRNGAINHDYKICYQDLVYGRCVRQDCESIHLTDQGLKCYSDQKNEELNTGILLNKKLIMERFIGRCENGVESDSSDEDLEGIIKYLNEHGESDNESIFKD